MPATRFKIPDVPDFFFEMEHSKERISLDNISVSGMGAQVNESSRWPEVGSIIAGKLIKSDRSQNTKAKVVHKTGKIIGLQFVDEQNKVEKFVTDEIMRDLFPHLKTRM